MKIEKRKADSFLFKSVPYKREPINMEHFNDINNEGQKHPEHDLIYFYLATQLLNEIQNRYEGQTLSTDQANYVDDLFGILETVFQRMFTYVMLISIGESRHGSAGYEATIEEKFGKDASELYKKIKGTTRAQSRFEFLQSDRDVLTFMEYCDWNFVNLHSGGSVGGPKWKEISQKCTQVLSGEISPYIMVDVSWAMVHNCGSIFNKNTIYYQAESFEVLCQLLDMQRGGAIAALVGSTATYNSMGIDNAHFSVLDEHRELLTDAKKLFELSEIDKMVSFPDIKQAGALSNLFKNIKGTLETGNLKPNEQKPAPDGLINLGHTIKVGPIDLAINAKVRDV